jgi:hypothetical protein
MACSCRHSTIEDGACCRAKAAGQKAPALTLLQGRLLKGGDGSALILSQVTVVTALPDPQLYPAQEILRACLLRWRLEMCLDDLKTSLEMETLRGRSEMAPKEVDTRLIAHNLIRGILAQAAAQHPVPLERISFKGSLDQERNPRT